MKGDLYLRVQLGLPHSDGAGILERHLGEKRAWSYTLEMWDWFASKHPEGEVTGPDAAYLIARGAGWDGDPDKFCSAQILAGYLASVSEGFRVRGWEKWAGFYFTVKAKERTKKAGQRKGHPPPCPPVCPGDVPGTSQGQGVVNGTSTTACPGDPSYISSSSDRKSSEGVQGERRTRLVSPYPAGQDSTPATSAVLAALWDRSIDASPPSEAQAPRVEAAIASVGVAVAVERLTPILSDPAAKRPLTYHVEAIRSAPKPKRRSVGDLGQEAHPWYTLLTDEERRLYREEREAVAPGLGDAPIGIVGPERECAELNDRWRQRVEERA